MAISQPWPVEDVRETFFSYFVENQHVQLSSTPVIPVVDTKVPLIHTCLNRFKGTLNGRGSHRTCFSLRCITVGGDDDEVIDHFKNDTTYHRFTEVLGSWSFGDYFKEEAIRLLFSLLNKKYKLPQSRIYASYFSGDTSLGLSSDNESKNTLQKYLAEERIMPAMSKADFWMTGETGPCGPCIGFFFDCSDSKDGVGSVINIKDGKFIEISRLVFVEFNRQAGGVLKPLQAKHVLKPLQAKHVLTGINLESLAAILQNKESHYELDVYDDIFFSMSCCTGRGIRDYSGEVGAADTDGVDTAYRLLADHIRMIAVTNAPGSQLGFGNEGREYFLYRADKQAVQYGHEVLKTNQEKYDVIIHGILISEADLCPELEGYRKVDEIIEDELMIYKKTMAELREQQVPFDMGGKKKKKKGVTSVVWYATRLIEFFGRHTRIILKNKNTRCSLVALCNALLLGEKITLNIDIEKVSEGHLIYLVQSYLLYGNTQMQLEQNLELSEFNKQVLGVLPKLPGSLYFDVTFASSCGFEQTSETAIFGFLGVPLHHGWLVDPQDAELGSSIRKSSYHQLSYILAVYESIRSSTNSGPQKHGGCKDDDKFDSTLVFSLTRSEELGSISCAMISTFLHGPQLTSYGFSSLHDDLKARQPTVLIWNETLITISKVGDQIYVLLNDLSLLSTETGAVWERLTEDSDGLFVDCNFVPTDSEIQSILPLTRMERRKRNREEKRPLKDLLVPEEKEVDKREDREGDTNEDEKDYEKTETGEKYDGNIVEKPDISGIRGNLNIRPIVFLGRPTHVIHQINDGPCALIAVCNLLLLQGSIFFEPHETVVSMEYLLNFVFSLLEDSAKMRAHCSAIQRNIWDAALTLATGFDVDVVFTRTDGFTETREWFLLDCLNLNLRHGWIAAGDLLRGPETSFESLTLAANEPGFPNAEAIKKFLTGPQLTPIGLLSLQEELTENVPCILYWNKHYNTTVKVNGKLCSLVTDSNYLRTSAVWQTLEVRGNGSYLDSNFTPIYAQLDAAPSFLPETSTSQASTSFMKQDLEGITSRGDGLYLDRSFTHSGPNAALSGDDLHGSHFVQKIRTRRSLPSPRIVPESSEVPLSDFVRIPGNEFSELRTLFADGTSLDVADTRKIGRVLGLDLLEDIVFNHNAGFSWDGKFDPTTIMVIDGVRAEIRAPYCDKFCEEAKLNDFFSYITGVIELFRIEGIGLPAFFAKLTQTLSNPPRRPQVCTQRQLEGFKRRLHGYWDIVLTTLALRSSLARAGLYSGIHRIHRFAPEAVNHALRAVLRSRFLPKDWRQPIVAETGHPVLKKVLRYIPDTLDGSNENARANEGWRRKFGWYKPRLLDSLCIFPRQVNEHAKSKELELEKQQGVENEPMNSLSELDLLTSHYLQDDLPIILEVLLRSDHLMTDELWKWLEEVLEVYSRPEVLGRGTWGLRRCVFGGGWNLGRRAYCRRGRAHGFGHCGHGRARGFGHRGHGRARGFGHR
ncbi:uncharacterized protein LOC119307462 isoform X2 [Triticum dicoccoides]|uniref:uncharacterized protein LOC119307462 isoform X2 n=1 Tax=Triticum dicoccoides TaxID=85692 RepID=UPI00188DE63E|nr:uncharacterized protein LOC119307462 isoform X2 [Triticum dicoccoides]